MDIALIGAGPRNLALLEALLYKWQKEPLSVTLFDPYPVGGRVWTPFFPQNETFLMNTVANQVTLFYDADGQEPSPQRPGLLTWAKQQGPAFLAAHPKYPAAYRQELTRLQDKSAYSSRGLMGVYAAWYYEQLVQDLPAQVTVAYQQTAVTACWRQPDQRYQLETANDATYLFDAVVWAPGHLDNQLSPRQADLAAFAKANKLHYYPAKHPAEQDLTALGPHDCILVQGLGLTFFDELQALTVAKGGRYERATDGHLLYHPSGQEPTLVLGSRSAFPAKARGVNQKAASQRHQPVFFTLDKLQQLAGPDRQLAYEDFYHLLDLELTAKSLTNQVAQLTDRSKDEQAAILAAIADPANWPSLNQRFGLSLATQIDWQALANPTYDPASGQSFQDFWVDQLRAELADAQLGNELAPLAGAFDLLRDLRHTVRTLFEAGYFSPAAYEQVLKTFRSLDNKLSAGPPLERIEQLLALVQSGQAQVAGPNFTVTAGAADFIGQDALGQRYHGTAFLEARLPKVDYRLAESPLLASLAAQGLLQGANWPQNSQGQSLVPQAVQVDSETGELIDQQGQPVPGLYLTGIPLEGTRWFTTVIPRPGVQTPIFMEAQRLAKHLVAGGTARDKRH
ncbi:FAD/NAD(P)-binding protein [Leuconostocaceae bacterium ESL0958]|nr:FAD/NAD(P)-binding protein [Leuconostocaceae bacterium ESL0958]